MEKKGRGEVGGGGGGGEEIVGGIVGVLTMLNITYVASYGHCIKRDCVTA